MRDAVQECAKQDDDDGERTLRRDVRRITEGRDAVADGLYASQRGAATGEGADQQPCADRGDGVLRMRRGWRDNRVGCGFVSVLNMPQPSRMIMQPMK